MERRRFGAAQDFELARQQLHLTRRERRVRRTGWARPYFACDAYAELAAQALRGREHILRIGIEHDLQQSFAIAQIDEDDPAMITPAVHPACNADVLADKGFVDLTAIVGAHGRGCRL